MDHRSKSQTGRRVVTAIVLALGMALAASTAAAGTNKGAAFVDAVDVARRIVVLEGASYMVAPSTPILGVEGEPIRLEQLRPVPEGLALVSTDEADIVAWEAVAGPDGWAITELRVLDEMPD